MAEVLAIKNGINVPPAMQVAQAKERHNTSADATNVCQVDQGP